MIEGSLFHPVQVYYAWTCVDKKSKRVLSKLKHVIYVSFTERICIGSLGTCSDRCDLALTRYRALNQRSVVTHSVDPVTEIDRELLGTSKEYRGVHNVSSRGRAGCASFVGESECSYISGGQVSLGWAV